MSPPVRRLRRPGPPRLAEWLVIVPEAQVHLLDLQWQLDVYEAFHTHWINRLSHRFCFYPLLWTYLAFAACVPLGSPLWSAWPQATNFTLAVPLMLVLIVWYVALDRVVGIVLAPFVVALAVSANLFAAAYGADAWWRILLYGVAPNMIALTLTHGFEPMPPPWTGSNRFVPLREWWRTLPLHRVVLAVGVTLFNGFFLEYWATLRFVPLQVLKLLHGLGYGRELTARARERAPLLLADFSTR